jgi:hypothetical protein
VGKGNVRHGAIRVAVLTGAGHRVVMPLLDHGFNVVGIAGLVDRYARLSLLDRLVTNCYWLLFRFGRPLYLS